MPSEEYAGDVLHAGQVDVAVQPLQLSRWMARSSFAQLYSSNDRQMGCGGRSLWAEHLQAMQADTPKAV
jgi:hypothetical protein